MVYIYVEFFSLFCAGMLAGIEVTVFFGLRAPLKVLEEQPQIRIRQALIRKMILFVPAVFVLTAISGVAMIVLHGTAPGFVFRCLGLFAVLIWALTTFIGTVPINEAVLAWQPNAPPANWKSLIKRWERLDAIRTWTALRLSRSSWRQRGCGYLRHRSGSSRLAIVMAIRLCPPKGWRCRPSGVSG